MEAQYCCPRCTFIAKLTSLRVHAMKKHDMSSKELYLTLFCAGIEPVCACGCGQPTTFDTITKGYPNKWIRGHVSRVKNSWGHNETAQKKSRATRRQMWKDGELDMWNTGLTKETDERVRQYGEAHAANVTPEQRAILANRM